MLCDVLWVAAPAKVRAIWKPFHSRCKDFSFCGVPRILRLRVVGFKFSSRAFGSVWPPFGNKNSNKVSNAQGLNIACSSLSSATCFSLVAFRQRFVKMASERVRSKTLGVARAIIRHLRKEIDNSSGFPAVQDTSLWTNHVMDMYRANIAASSSNARNARIQATEFLDYLTAIKEQRVSFNFLELPCTRI